MNSKFKSVLLSTIIITDSEISYKEKNKSATINVSDITAFDVVEGTISKYGYIKIVERGNEHVVQFLSNYNRDIRKWQEHLGFTNQTEPMNVKELETFYNREIVEAGITIHIKDTGLSYKSKVSKNEGYIKANRIKSVEFKPAKGLSLGILIIHTFTEDIEIKVTSGFTKPLEKWMEDINDGIYKIDYDDSIGNTANDNVSSNKEPVTESFPKQVDKQLSQANKDNGANTFGNWERDIHLDYEQVDRILKAEKIIDDVVYIDASVPIAKIQGSSEEPYIMNFDECECIDFERRGLPCKHMYALALSMGVGGLLPESKKRSSVFNAEIEIEKYKILYKRGDITPEAYTKICSAIAKAKKMKHK